MPKKPSAPIRRSTSRGTKPCFSQASPNGLISSSTKRRTWSRSISCSSVKNGERAFDPCLPFGLNARQHIAWMTHGGGAALVQDLFSNYNIRVFRCGNTGAQMAGWFRQEIKTVDDFNGLKFRTGGLAGQVLAKLGVVT